MIECPLCRGMGVRPAPVVVWCRMFMATVPVPCYRCGGSGQVNDRPRAESRGLTAVGKGVTSDTQ